MRVVIGLLAAAAAAATACAPFHPTVNVDARPLAERVDTAEVRIVSRTELTGLRYRVLGSVEAVSSRFWFSDPAGSEEDARLQLRWFAMRDGADAVMDVRCAPASGGRDVCCTGVAVARLGR